MYNHLIRYFVDVSEGDSTITFLTNALGADYTITKGREDTCHGGHNVLIRIEFCSKTVKGGKEGIYIRKQLPGYFNNRRFDWGVVRPEEEVDDSRRKSRER